MEEIDLRSEQRHNRATPRSKHNSKKNRSISRDDNMMLGASLGGRSRADSLRSNRSSRALFDNFKEIIAADNKKHKYSGSKKIQTIKQ